MTDYDALGRYTHARDEAERARAERRRSLFELAALIRPAAEADSGGYFAFGFNSERAEQLLAEAADAHARMTAAIAEANAQAERCGRARLKVLGPD